MIYYAHCMSIYNSLQEERDIDTLKKLFPKQEIYNPNNWEAQQGYMLEGMSYFLNIIEKDISIMAFRGLPNGKITAGIMKEVKHALALGIPVIELPCFTGREMSVDDTRFYLKECGYR